MQYTYLRTNESLFIPAASAISPLRSRVKATPCSYWNVQSMVLKMTLLAQLQHFSEPSDPTYLQNDTCSNIPMYLENIKSAKMTHLHNVAAHSSLIPSHNIQIVICMTSHSNFYILAFHFYVLHPLFQSFYILIGQLFDFYPLNNIL